MINEEFTYYKCCWNCLHGLRACAKTQDEADKFNSSKRFCFAPYPVSNHSVNPFQQRYCKQFEPHVFVSFGHNITKEEADILNKMSVDELIDYWKEGADND